MDYKKILRNSKTRYAILRALSWIPDGLMVRFQYLIKFGRFPNIRHPRRYTEKIQNYKLRYHNPLMHQCVDKYDVREYVKSKGLENILNECYGVYDSVDDIKFNNLPKEFVLKATWGGGGNNVILIDDKNSENYSELKSTISKWCEEDIDSFGREWAYKGLKKRFIVEKYLHDENAGRSIDDYKFLCFNGKFRYLWVDKDRNTNHKRGFWDRELNFLPNVVSDHETFEVPPVLPKNIHEMIAISETLSKDFPHARIDLYNIKGDIIFGEITFYSLSGYVNFTPDSFDYELGSYFQIENYPSK